MLSDWFHGVEIVQGRWQRGEEVGNGIPVDLQRPFVSGIYVPLVTKGLTL